VAVTAANVHDSRVVEDFLHGEGRRVRGDSANAGQQEVFYHVITNILSRKPR